MDSSAGEEGAAREAFSLVRAMSSARETAGEGTVEDEDGGGGNDLGGDGVLPDARDYLAALRACASPGEWQLALRLLTDVKLAAAGNAAGDASVGVRRVASSAETGGVEGVASPPVRQTPGVVPCSRRLLPEHYQAAIAACGRGGNASGVLALLSELRRGGGGGGGGSGDMGEAGEAGGMVGVQEETGGEEGGGDRASGLRSPALGGGDGPGRRGGEERVGGGGGGGGTVGVDGDWEREVERAAKATRAAMVVGIIPALSPVRDAGWGWGGMGRGEGGGWGVESWLDLGDCKGCLNLCSTWWLLSDAVLISPLVHAAGR